MNFYDSKFVWWCFGAWAMGWAWGTFGEEVGARAIGAVVLALIGERLVAWKVNRDLRRASPTAEPSSSETVTVDDVKPAL